MESDHNKAIKNPGNDLQAENIDIALNWEQGVLKQILNLTLFKTIEKRGTYENKANIIIVRKIHQHECHKNPVTVLMF